MKLLHFLPVVIFLFLAACNTEPKKTEAAKNQVDSTKFRTALDIEPDLRNTDSLEIVYYDNPDGDPERYTRFFKFTASSDSSDIATLVKNIDQPIVSTELGKCRSQGKIFFRNQSDIINTLYFSTRGDSCSYLYYIKTGAYYYVKINKEAENVINRNRPFAKAPGVN
jgi:hypothetical protein